MNESTENAKALKPKESIQPEERRLSTCIVAPEGDDMVGFDCFRILMSVVREKERKRLPEKWYRNYELYRAKHWRSQGAIPLSSVNLIWNHVERTVNLLTDNNPNFDIQAEEQDVADKINRLAQYWWNETEQQDVLTESIKMAEVSGCVIEKTVFNPSLLGGIGEVETITVDPYNFGFWPINEKNQAKWQAVLHYYTMPISEARRKWPKVAEYIKPDADWRERLGQRRREVFGGSARPMPGTTFVGDRAVDHASLYGNSPLLSKILGEGDEVLILELWVRDHTLEDQLVEPEQVVIDQTTLEPLIIPEIREKRAKYPGYIRCITSCNGGEVILSDRPNPSINPLLPREMSSMTYLYERFPFTLTQSTKDPVSPWGFSSIEQLEQLNFEIDKCLSQLNLLKDKAVRSPIINPKNCQVPNSAFTNAPAKVVQPKDHVSAAGIRHLEPPPRNQDIEQVMQIYRELFDRISGMFDMTDPNLAKGRMAYKTMASILESMHTMVRGKIRGYGKMIRERGRMFLSHVMNWYTEERMIFTRNKGTIIPDTVYGREMIIPCHFQVVSGSTMPHSRMQQREEAIELFNAKGIDNRELLDRLEWPNRAEVIKRMEMGIAGPILERMQALGAAPEVIQMVQRIAEMDESEYNAAVNQIKKAQADAAKAQEKGPEMPKGPMSLQQAGALGGPNAPV